MEPHKPDKRQLSEEAKRFLLTGEGKGVFLFLPDRLIVKMLSYLPLSDLFAAQKSNKHIKNLGFQVKELRDFDFKHKRYIKSLRVYRKVSKIYAIPITKGERNFAIQSMINLTHLEMSFRTSAMMNDWFKRLFVKYSQPPPDAAQARDGALPPGAQSCISTPEDTPPTTPMRSRRRQSSLQNGSSSGSQRSTAPFRSLRSLSLRIHQLDQSVLASIPGAVRPQITCLSLSVIDPLSLRALESFSNLRILRISPLASNYQLRPFPRLPYLQVLRISSTAFDLNDVPVFLAHCPRLNTLRVETGHIVPCVSDTYNPERLFSERRNFENWREAEPEGGAAGPPTREEVERYADIILREKGFVEMSQARTRLTVPLGACMFHPCALVSLIIISSCPVPPMMFGHILAAAPQLRKLTIEGPLALGHTVEPGQRGLYPLECWSEAQNSRKSEKAQHVLKTTFFQTITAASNSVDFCTPVSELAHTRIRRSVTFTQDDDPTRSAHSQTEPLARPMAGIIAHLPTTLTSLAVPSVPFNSDALKMVSRLPNLENLTIASFSLPRSAKSAHRRFSSAFPASPFCMPKLKSLSVTHPSVIDIVVLARTFPNLVSLDLAGPFFTGPLATPPRYTFQRLKQLTVAYPEAPPERLSFLFSAMPRLRTASFTRSLLPAPFGCAPELLPGALRSLYFRYTNANFAALFEFLRSCVPALRSLQHMIISTSREHTECDEPCADGPDGPRPVVALENLRYLQFETQFGHVVPFLAQFSRAFAVPNLLNLRLEDFSGDVVDAAEVALDAPRLEQLAVIQRTRVLDATRAHIPNIRIVVVASLGPRERCRVLLPAGVGCQVMTA
eukprot:gnl/Chilomastix_cuspidata/1647.p1 GENE.gnl/Chilomastix_cuspidata/1647~~gnl/Chilomastix_cuspidata/1647.p1  ORF type:complete len:843 (+),score=411.68 gnl/Chilomastix_cuspidata/1647:45-2573(+)